MRKTTRYIYLHGWASSPNSAKARFFKQQFANLNIPLTIPDLNQADFYRLTLSRQLAQVENHLQNQPAVLLGSSFGALTALWLAERNPAVERLVLVAPAVCFTGNVQRLLGEARYRQWQAQQSLMIYHYAWQQEAKLHYRFMEDMQLYPDSALQRRLPILILHGRRDEVIPVQQVEAFAAARPWMRLEILDSDHGLVDKGPLLWRLAAEFLGFGGVPNFSLASVP